MNQKELIERFSEPGAVGCWMVPCQRLTPELAAKMAADMSKEKGISYVYCPTCGFVRKGSPAKPRGSRACPGVH